MTKICLESFDEISFLDEVKKERKRQISEEKWSLENDDRQTEGQMLMAATAYTLLAAGKPMGVAAMSWPDDWDIRWLKHDPENPQRSLVKAGALMAAESERLERAALKKAA